MTRFALADADPQPLFLRDALTHWADPALVEAVKAAERRFTATEPAPCAHPRLSALEDLRKPTPQDWMLGGLCYGALGAAWKELLRDFRSRVERGEIYLEGVIEGEPGKPVRRAIDGVWAGDLEFEFERNAVRHGPVRYRAVWASPHPPQEDGASASTLAPHGGPDLRPEQVPDLSDDTILALLEEHVKRVAEDPDADLIAPGKISLMPIIRRKMRHRAAQGEILPTLSAEAAWLAK